MPQQPAKKPTSSRPTFIFDRILEKAKREGRINNFSRQSSKWFRDQAKSLGRPSDQKKIQETQPGLEKFTIGQMYCYAYDPKHKLTLPYYDIFPLVFPFDIAQGGFLGINLHYLPYSYRAKLMDALFHVQNTIKFTDATKLNINYRILKGISNYVQPCIKHYLLDHVRSKFYKISSQYWNMALFLPIESFQKETKQQVWADSTEMIKNS